MFFLTVFLLLLIAAFFFIPPLGFNLTRSTDINRFMTAITQPGIHARAFMSDLVDTVMVKGENGDPVRVNRSDYDADPEAFDLMDDQAQPEAPAATDGTIDTPIPATGEVVKVPEGVPAASSVATPTYLVSNTGTKTKPVYSVVNENGEKVEDVDGINAKGYKTEKEAWDAIMAVQNVAG